MTEIELIGDRIYINGFLAATVEPSLPATQREVLETALGEREDLCQQIERLGGFDG